MGKLCITQLLKQSRWPKRKFTETKAAMRCNRDFKEQTRNKNTYHTAHLNFASLE